MHVIHDVFILIVVALKCTLSSVACPSTFRRKWLDRLDSVETVYKQLTLRSVISAEASLYLNAKCSRD